MPRASIRLSAMKSYYDEEKQARTEIVKRRATARASFVDDWGKDQAESKTWRSRASVIGRSSVFNSGLSSMSKSRSSMAIMFERSSSVGRFTTLFNSRELGSRVNLKSNENSKQELHRKETKVSFSNVNIQEYQSTICDNPSCRLGPPVSLDWKIENSYVVDVDAFETGRGEPRDMKNMVLDCETRINIVDDSGCSKPDIYEMMKSVRKTRIQRKKTLTFLKMAPLEEALEVNCNCKGI